jgi:hypothetical protein
MPTTLRIDFARLSWMVCLLCTSPFHAQFAERSAELNVELNGSYSYFGAGTSFYDFNKDGLDDITVCSTDSGAQVFENAGDHFVERFYFAELLGELKHAVWVDFDNDGDNDFFVTRMNDKPYLLRNEGDYTFTDVSSALPCPDNAPFSTCCSWGDYDNDSFLDLYVVNYYFFEGLVSWLFHNNGDGTFDEVATEMNMDNGINPGFQSLWMDYNLDGDIDLMVLNDKYHGCKLYDNDGSGHFTDIGDQTNFNRIADNMGITASDFDHDGDFDFYITITEGNLLLRNDNGIFTDVGEAMNVDTHCTSWSGVFIDSDNQTWEDLYVLSTSVCNSTINYFYENDEGMNFIEHDTMFNEANEATAYSASKGDWNNDGLYDIIVSNGPVTGMRLWENQNANANWIRVAPEGTVSNTNAVGAIVRCYIDGLCLMRAVACGDGFMSQDSQNILIGLGAASQVDSLSVTYLSGWVDTYYDLDVNSFYRLTEGETFESTSEVIFVSMCPGTSCVLNAGIGASYSWSTNEFDSSIVVASPGVYEVEMINVLGYTVTKYFHVNEIDLPEIQTFVSEPNCFDEHSGSLELLVPIEEVVLVIWSDTAQGTYRDQLHSGIYSCEISWTNNCVSSYEITINEPEPIQLVVITDTICYDSTVNLDYTVSGGVGTYTLDWFGANPESMVAGIYEVEVRDEHFCSAHYSFEIFTFDSIVFNYNYEIPCDGLTTSLVYDVVGDESTQIIFGDVDPNEISEGNYGITILDAHGCLSQHAISITSFEPLTFDYSYVTPCFGQSTSITYAASGGAGSFDYDFGDLDPLNISAGNFEVTITDVENCSSTFPFEILENDALELSHEIQELSDDQFGMIALNTFGGAPPYTFLWSDNSTENYLFVTVPGVYNCTITDSIGCSVHETFEMINLNIEQHISTYRIYPNPMSDWLTIEVDTPSKISFYDALGKLIFSSASFSSIHQIDVAFLSAGIYFVEVNGAFYKIAKR